LIKKESSFRLLNITLATGVILVAIIGIFYSTKGQRFTTVNMYGDTVELYGDGLYAFNSVLTVANRLGADVTGIIAAIGLIISTLWKKRTLLIEVIETSVIIYLTYHLACLVFGISMNSLYFVYVICFGIALFIAFSYVRNLMQIIEVPQALKKERLTGTGIFLIVVGTITALLWISAIIPPMLNNSFGTLLGIQTTEATYGIDLSITCPIFIMCGIWLLMKKDIGYKIAPILLSVMVGIAILVINQRNYCTKLGINIPIQALIGFIISFVIMGIISLFLFIKLVKGLKEI
jgi:hypothetical protein